MKQGEYMKEEIKELLNDIKYLIKEAEHNINQSEPGTYHDGWFHGECNAYEVIYERLENIIKKEE